MPKTDSEHIKFQIESTKGTMIKSDMFLSDGMYEITYAYYCKRCLSPFPEYKFLRVFRLYLWNFFHKCEESKIKGIENIKISISRLEDDIPTNRNQRR